MFRAPDADIVAQEGRRVEDDKAVPAALDREGQAARDAVQRVWVRDIGRLLQEEVAVRVPGHPDVIELHRGLRLQRPCYYCYYYTPIQATVGLGASQQRFYDSLPAWPILAFSPPCQGQPKTI